MKISALSLAIALLVSVAAEGQAMSQTRVLRVGMEGGAIRWLVGVNTNKPCSFASGKDLSKYITQLGLQHGDLIIFKELPPKDQIDGFFDGLGNYCRSNKVALYLFGGRGDCPLSEFFSVPIYSWTGPFNDPRTLSTAKFYDNGCFLGAGKDGFEKMVHSIAKKRVPKILILGSLYNEDAQFGFLEAPYEDQKEALDQVLKKNRTELVYPDQLP